VSQSRNIGLLNQALAYKSEDIALIVLIAGMWRSGSTFTFNVARDVLMRRGTVHQESTTNFDTAMKRAGHADHVLVKSHGLVDPAALAGRAELRVICSTRRVEDAYASWVEAFCWEEDRTIAIMREWLDFYEAMRGSALTLRYRQIDRMPWLSALRIGRFIAPDVTPWEAWSIARRHAKTKVKRQVDDMRPDDPGTVDVGFSYYDNATFFHRRHVSTVRSRPAETRLDAETLTRVRAALGKQAESLGIN
jgi:hypothetical protein